MIFLSGAGKVLYNSRDAQGNGRIDERYLADLPQHLGLADEMEFVFENGRIYVRKIGDGVLILFLNGFAPVALVRMQCDVIRPGLEDSEDGKKKSRLFGIF